MTTESNLAPMVPMKWCAIHSVHYTGHWPVSAWRDDCELVPLGRELAVGVAKICQPTKMLGTETFVEGLQSASIGEITSLTWKTSTLTECQDPPEWPPVPFPAVPLPEPGFLFAFAFGIILLATLTKKRATC